MTLPYNEDEAVRRRRLAGRCMLDNAQTQVRGHGEGRRSGRVLRSEEHHFRHPGPGLACVAVQKTMSTNENVVLIASSSVVRVVQMLKHTDSTLV